MSLFQGLKNTHTRYIHVYGEEESVLEVHVSLFSGALVGVSIVSLCLPPACFISGGV